MFYYILHHYGNYERIKGKMFRGESCKNAFLWRVLLKMLKFWRNRKSKHNAQQQIFINYLFPKTNSSKRRPFK